MGEKTAMKLTPAQQMAIETRGRSILVSAAAGSGKTKVLVNRIIHMIMDGSDPVDIDQLLVVTFTDAAAAEMRRRIGEAISREQDKDPRNPRLARQRLLLQRASISTLHAFASRTVRRFFYLLDVDPAFSVADENEIGITRGDLLWSIIEKRLEARDESTALLVERFGDFMGKERLAEVVGSVYDFARAQKDPDAWLGSCLTDKKHAWCSVVVRSAATQLAGAREAILEASKICARDGGPGEYSDILELDLRAMDDMLAIVERAGAGGWDDIFTSLAWEPKRLPPSRKADPDLKALAQAFRKSAKDILTDVRKLFGKRSWDQLDEVQEELHPELSGLLSLIREFHEQFSAYKRNAGLLDFADLEQYCLAALANPEVAEVLRSEYREVMVDECQDISPVQEAIISSVAAGGPTCDNLFMVGDVKQSIYRFRLAEPSLFIQRQDAYSTDASKRGGLRINLSENFRSQPGVIDAVNYVFDKLMTGGPAELSYDEDARLLTHKTAGPKPRAYILETGEENEDDEDLATTEREARFVAREIARLLGKTGEPPLTIMDEDSERPVTYGDFAVLLRAATGVAGIFADELRALGIPTYADLATGYFAATEVAVFMSLLQVIDNQRQDIPLAAAMRSPMFAFSAKDLAEIRLSAEGQLCDAVLAMAGSEGELGPKCSAFLERLDRWRTISRQRPAAFLIEDILESTHYDLIVERQPQGKHRVANLVALSERARQFDRMGRPGLQRFLRFIERLRSRGSDLGPPSSAGDSGDVVRIMSIHKSKGLEFPVVFVPCLHRQWNRTDLHQDILHHRDLGIGLLACDRRTRTKYETLGHRAIAQKLKEEALAEEMRVLYVAMTRAKEFLILSSSIRNVGTHLKAWAAEDGITHSRLLRARGFMDLLGPLLATGSEWFQVKAVTALPMMPEATLRDDAEAGTTPLDEATFELVKEQIEWEYPFQPLTELPAKISASEAYRYSLEGEPAVRSKSPVPRRNQGAVAASRGTAVHAVMERLDLCGDLSRAGVEEQVRRFVEKGFMTPEEAAMVDSEMVSDFFESDLGSLMRTHTGSVSREVVFTITLPAENIYPGLADREGGGDPVVVQGVIDCIIDTGEGYVIIDYKTDDVDEEEVPAVAARYRPQLEIYARAASMMKGSDPAGAYLAFLSPRVTRMVR